MPRLGLLEFELALVIILGLAREPPALLPHPLVLLQPELERFMRFGRAAGARTTNRAVILCARFLATAIGHCAEPSPWHDLCL
jgi:hypothetical protein